MNKQSTGRGPGRPQLPPQTLFAHWMHEMGYATIEEAAEALGISRSRCASLRTGNAYMPGRSAEPDQELLLAMAALKAGLPPYCRK